MPDKTFGLVPKNPMDWSIGEKDAVAATVGKDVTCDEFPWSGDIGFHWIVKGWPNGGPCGTLSNVIQKLINSYSVILVAHSAGGCLSAATANGMAAMKIKGPTMIIRLDSPPMDPKYVSVPCPVFDAMDPWDLCVMDYARWNVPDVSAYGLHLSLPTNFPTVDGLNPEYSSHRIRTYDPAEACMYPPTGVPYLTLGQFGKDLVNYYLKKPGPFKQDLNNCIGAVLIHLDALGKDYWVQLNAAWQTDIRSLLK
jgi:hypothetical protein